MRCRLSVVEVASDIEAGSWLSKRGTAGGASTPETALCEIGNMFYVRYQNAFHNFPERSAPKPDAIALRTGPSRMPPADVDRQAVRAVARPGAGQQTARDVPTSLRDGLLIGDFSRC
jgi:hypothetical protein